jgi:hypothetical protein
MEILNEEWPNSTLRQDSLQQPAEKLSAKENSGRAGSWPLSDAAVVKMLSLCICSYHILT